MFLILYPRLENPTTRIAIVMVHSGLSGLKLETGNSTLEPFIHYLCTGKSFSELLILASTDPQYDKRFLLFTHVLPMFCACSFHGISMNNLLSYCRLIDAKMIASDKDLPVLCNIFPL